MAKNKTTVTQGYYNGAPQIASFMKKEIGDNKTFRKEWLKAQAEFAKIEKWEAETEKTDQASRDKLDNRLEALKAAHHRAYSPMLNYGKTLKDLFDKDTVIDMDILSQLIKKNQNIAEYNVFDRPTLKWSSEASVNAIKKFTEIVVENDYKKFQYYHECLRVGNTHKIKPVKGIPLKEVLDRPLPTLEDPTPQDKTELTNSVKNLLQRLNNADTRMHRNSSEFKAMKAALNSLNEGLKSGVEPEEIGSRLEALQATSMEYVKAKGVGRQSSQLGIDRMDIALDICKMSAEKMSKYASKLRISEIQQFEKDTFGMDISKNGQFDYDISTEQYMAMPLLDIGEMENNEIEKDGMEMG